MLTIEISPVEADKITSYIDDQIRQGGLEAAMEFVSLAEKIKSAKAALLQEENEAGRAHLSSNGVDDESDPFTAFD
jgi:hypothetical protein